MALADGLSTEDANTKAMSQLWGNEVYQRSVGLIRALPGIAKDGGADLLASLGAGAGIKLAQSTDSPMDSYVSIQMEHAALSLVPPDTEYGATGISVKERLAILDKEEDMWKETQKLVIEELNASDAITKQLYMENYVSRGVIEANRLLLEKKTR